MANILAAQSGNWNATATWTGGVVPGAGDNAYANGMTVTVNVAATCALVSTVAENGAAVGGIFALSDGVTLTARCAASSGYQCVRFSVAAPGIANVIGNAAGGGNGSACINNNSSGTLTITGDLTGTSDQAAITVANNSSGTINIIGTVTGGAGYSSPTVINGTGIVNIIGTVTGGAGYRAYGVSNASTGTVNITGTVTGGVGYLAYGVNNASTGTVNITGTANGGSSYGVNNAGTGTVNVTGNPTGGVNSACYGVNNASTGTVNVTGNPTGGAGATSYGAINSSAGTLAIVGNATGNAFGLGSVGLVECPGVSASSTGITTVTGIQYGSRGQTPTVGNVFIVSNNSTARFRKTTKTDLVNYDTLTLTNSDDPQTTYPVAADVRYGTSCKHGDIVGTLRVPAAGSVALGVLTDATAGTAILTGEAAADAVWNRLLTAITTSGSIGKRLKDVATVQAVGDLLAALETP